MYVISLIEWQLRLSKNPSERPDNTLSIIIDSTIQNDGDDTHLKSRCMKFEIGAIWRSEISGEGKAVQIYGV